MKTTKRILFVCLGNICRSPMAEGIFRHKINERQLPIETDSAGTGDWHVGDPPDARMQETAKANGIDISDLRGRQFTAADFDRFDQIYVMDESNRDNVLKLARNDQDRAKVEMMLNTIFPGEDMSVPDPYFGGRQGFEQVFDLLDRASDEVLKDA
jgi:protein-tyrosine phosphatase